MPSSRTVIGTVGGIVAATLALPTLAFWASCGSNERLAMLAVRLPWPERCLMTIVRKGQLDGVRLRALHRIESGHSKFVDLALDPALPSLIHKAAARRLYANSPDRLRVIGKTSDPELCVDMVNQQASSSSTAGVVTRPLIDRITNQKLLYAVAVGAQAAEARELAVRKLTDQEQLFHCAEHDASWAVRRAASERLSRDDLIVDLVRSRAGAARDVGAGRKDDNVCAATAHLTDKSLLAKMATTDPAADVRMLAVSCLWDATALGHVVAKDPSWDVRAAAVKHLVDEPLLLRLAHGRSRLRDAARARLFQIVPLGKDQPRLRDLAVRHPDPLVRQIAAARLTDRPTLARIAAKDRSPEVRQAARARFERLRPQVTTGSTSGGSTSTGVPTAYWHDPPRNHSAFGWTVSVPDRY